LNHGNVPLVLSSGLIVSFIMYPRQLIRQRGLGGISDINISQKKNFQPVKTLAGEATAAFVSLPAMLGSAQNILIQPVVDGATLTQATRNRAKLGPAFADALAADANIADAVPHHEAQAQLQAQFPSGESVSFVAARAADAAIAASAARSRRAGCGTHKWHARRTSLCLQWQAGGGSRRAIGTKRCSVRFDRDAPGAAHTSGAQGAHPAAGRGRRMGGRDVR
jgi:hypothetical protein